MIFTATHDLARATAPLRRATITLTIDGTAHEMTGPEAEALVAELADVAQSVSSHDTHVFFATDPGLRASRIRAEHAAMERRRKSEQHAARAAELRAAEEAKRQARREADEKTAADRFAARQQRLADERAEVDRMAAELAAEQAGK